MCVTLCPGVSHMYLYVDTFPRLAPVQYHTVRCWTIKLDYIRSTLAIDSEKGLELMLKNCHFMKLVSLTGGTSLLLYVPELQLV